jgi:hypothetical protein
MSEEKTEESVNSTEVEDLKKEVALQTQYASQHEGNAKRERQANEELKSQVSASEAKMASLAQDMEALKTQQLNKSQYKDMDKDLVDESVRGNMEALQSQMAAVVAKLDKATSKISDYEKNEEKRATDNQRNTTKDELCSELDTKYDPKYRSKALLMAQEKVDAGEVKPTRDRLDAYRLLNTCYSELAEADKTKTSTLTDDGKGSKTVVKNRENKGTFKDVLKDMKKTFKLTKET